MLHTARHNEPLARRKIDRAIFEVDEQTPVNHVKEFIEFFVLVPVIFALHDTKPDHRVVHLAERLIPPFFSAFIGELADIDDLQWLMENIEKRLVRKGVRFGFHGQNICRMATSRQPCALSSRAKLGISKFASKSHKQWLKTAKRLSNSPR